jgi:predicted nucleic acid-binding Zn ribbon protein
MPITSDEQINLKCVVCGLPIPAKRIDGLRSEILGIQVKDVNGLLCSERCHALTKTYAKPLVERKTVRA